MAPWDITLPLPTTALFVICTEYLYYLFVGQHPFEWNIRDIKSESFLPLEECHTLWMSYMSHSASDNQLILGITKDVPSQSRLMYIEVLSYPSIHMVFRDFLGRYSDTRIYWHTNIRTYRHTDIGTSEKLNSATVWHFSCNLNQQIIRNFRIFEGN